MARIPESEIERLKTEISLERLVEASGVKLRRSNQSRIGLCPFHDDTDPSLVITPEKNLWQCFGACQAGGSVFDWVMRAEGVTFPRAFALLVAGYTPKRLVDGRRRPASPPLVDDVELAPEAEPGALLAGVVDLYHTTLLKSEAALAYLARRKLDCPELIETFKLGYSDRSLAYRLPPKRGRGSGSRSRLQEIGILRKTGHEHFSGSLVVPVIGPGGEVAELYGRKIGDRLRKGTPLHLYLPGPHRGVWNAPSLADCEEVILCESLIDAMTFWAAGYRHVTATYGTNGFTDDHRELLVGSRVGRVLIAFDRDAAGDKAAHALATQLLDDGLDCYRIQFPRGMDANDVAVASDSPAVDLGTLIRAAAWLGKGRPPGPPAIERPEPPSLAAPPDPTPKVKPKLTAGPTLPPKRTPQKRPPPPPTEAAPRAGPPDPPSSPEPPSSAAPPPPASPVQPASAAEPEIIREHDERQIVIELDDRRYRIRGFAKNTAHSAMKVNVMVTRGPGAHLDTLDLYAARARGHFIREAAREVGASDDAIKRDLARIVWRLEQLQDQQVKDALEPQRKAVVLTEAQRQEAMALLKSPDLLVSDCPSGKRLPFGHPEGQCK